MKQREIVYLVCLGIKIEKVNDDLSHLIHFFPTTTARSSPKDH